MKHLNFFQLFIFLLISSAIFSCKEEVPEIVALTKINLSNTTLYEKLPIGTIAALLSTDIESSDIQYKLVAGEGAENNDQFEIRNGVLSTKIILDYQDGANRQIRIQASLGEAMIEEALTININEFNEEYPMISSSSFADDELMPRNFGANNGNISPDLEIINIPSKTISIVLTMRDLDDNSSWHWAVWNIPADKSEIAQNTTWQANTIEGNNDFGIGYIGPFPPSEHRYEITAFFLEDSIDLTPEDYGKLPTATIGKIIAQASIIGRYRP